MTLTCVSIRLMYLTRLYQVHPADVASQLSAAAAARRGSPTVQSDRRYWTRRRLYRFGRRYHIAARYLSTRYFYIDEKATFPTCAISSAS